MLFRSSGLLVLHIVWPPEISVEPHEHNLWAVMGNLPRRRGQHVLPAYGIRESSARGRCGSSRGTRASWGEEAIHAVDVPTLAPTGAIHVYGGDLITTARSEFDPASGAERPLRLEEVGAPVRGDERPLGGEGELKGGRRATRGAGAVRILPSRRGRRGSVTGRPPLVAGGKAGRHASRKLRGLGERGSGRGSVGGEGHGDPPLAAACIEGVGVAEVGVLSRSHSSSRCRFRPRKWRTAPVSMACKQPPRVAVHLAGKLREAIDEVRGDGAGCGEHVAVDGPASTLSPRLDPRPCARGPQAESGLLVR